MANLRPMVEGEALRDWVCGPLSVAVFPYDPEFVPIDIDAHQKMLRYLWPGRTCLANNKMFGGKTKVQAGLKWYEYGRLTSDKLRTPLSIAFAFVSTHNHFVLDRGGKVFNRSAPVIKLLAGATEEDHLALLGLLNSSTACFWMKQTFHNKGSTVDERGARQRTTPFEDFYEFTGTGLQSFPLPQEDCVDLAREIDMLASEAATDVPRTTSAFEAVQRRGQHWQATLERMIGLQEEIDWRCYRFYGLIDCASVFAGTVPPVRLGQRAFEIAMARKMAAGELKTAWFERHRSIPITEIPPDWPESYRQVIQCRIEVIESNPEIALIEQPEYKRRWNVEPWKEQVERALREWLLDRLESQRYWSDVAVTSVARLADRARQDSEFMRVATLYRAQDDFDVSVVVSELVDSAAVPFLPVLRYRASGLRKREQWERTWDLQRREDAGQDVGEIPVPPKYTSGDFANGVFWQLRGKLDVPKERFISYPFCQRDADPTSVITWAGCDHLQQAKALATYYVQMKESEGWSTERLMPLLAGLLELLPWLVQWHNEIDPEYRQRMGEYFQGFVDEEARALGVTRDAIRAWAPPARATRRRGRRTEQSDH